MFSPQKTLVAILAVALLAPLSVANTSKNQVLKWLMFANDDHCFEGVGISMDISNPGCLRESGRESILFHGPTQPRGYSVVMSPDPNCTCQRYCQKVPGWPPQDCWNISEYKWAQSFRFQRQVCGPNTC